MLCIIIEAENRNVERINVQLMINFDDSFEVNSICANFYNRLKSEKLW